MYELIAYQPLVESVRDACNRARDSLTAAITECIEAGSALAFAKSKLKHGEWIPFLKAVGVKRRTASQLMSYHENRYVLEAALPATWAEADRAIRLSKKATEPNGQYTAHLESPVAGSVIEVQSSVSASETVPAYSTEDEEEDEHANYRRKYRDAIKFASKLEGYDSAMFVAEILTQIPLDSREFDLIGHEIFVRVRDMFNNNSDHVRECLEHYSELFYFPLTTPARVAARLSYLIREIQELDEHFPECNVAMSAVETLKKIGHNDS